MSSSSPRRSLSLKATIWVVAGGVLLAGLHLAATDRLLVASAVFLLGAVPVLILGLAVQRPGVTAYRQARPGADAVP